MSSINRISRTNRQDSTEGHVLLHGTFVGFVKDNQDTQKMGRIAVHIPEIGGDPDDPKDWIIVGYASPFAGSTSPKGVRRDDKTAKGSQSSYGFWAVPPDLDNEVLVTFVNGDLARGYWIGCVFQQNMNQMVPGIANARTDDPDHKGGAPTVEYNKASAANPDDPTRPVYAPLADGLKSQGLGGDLVRGPATSSARRDGCAKVYGMLSPGGSQMYIDDDDDNAFIRMRTKSGAQVLISETTGVVYINSKGGNSWLEVSDDGVDIYSQGSVSLRAEKDFNLRADQNILLDAGGTIFMRAGADLNIQTVSKITAATAGDIVLAADGKLALTVQGDFLTTVQGANRSDTFGAVSVKARDALILDAGGDLSAQAGGSITLQAPTIRNNPGSAPQAPSVSETPAKVPEPTDAPDIQDGKPGTTKTIVNRMPTHEPWRGHINPKRPPPYTGPADGANPDGNGSSDPESRTSLGDDGETRCKLGVGTKSASDSVYNAIKGASGQTGVPFGALMAFGDVESSFDPKAGSGKSSAKGLFQFIDGTWSETVKRNGNKYNVSQDQILDPNANALMGGALYNYNAKALQSRGIKDPSVGQVYMTHMLGEGSGPKFVQAYQQNPDAPLSSVLSAREISNNPVWFRGKATIRDAYENLDGTMNAKASAYAGQAGMEAPCSRAGNSGPSANGGGGSGTPVAVSGDARGLASKYAGTVSGNGQCVALVKSANGLGPTATWKQGDPITPENIGSIPSGSPIATFQNGRYQNRENGDSHAAVLLGPGKTADGRPGIQVLDQWKGQAAAVRVLPFNAYNKTPANNGSSFSLINT